MWILIYRHCPFVIHKSHDTNKFILRLLRSKSKKTIYTDGLLTFTWQRPTFPGPFGPSIIGPGGLNFRVRDGNGWNPSGIITRSESILSKLHRVFQCQKSFSSYSKLWAMPHGCGECRSDLDGHWERSPFRVVKPIVTRLGQALGLLVPVSSTCHHASTSGLSTWSSFRGLTNLTLWEISSWGWFRT